MLHFVYLLVNSKGITYLGATSNLKSRLRQHSHKRNKGYTKGQKWHLLGCRSFATRKKAFAFEAKLKRDGKERQAFKCSWIERAKVLCMRHKYRFNFEKWIIRKDIQLKTSELSEWLTDFDNAQSAI